MIDFMCFRNVLYKIFTLYTIEYAYMHRGNVREFLFVIPNFNINLFMPFYVMSTYFVSWFQRDCFYDR